MTMLFRRIGAVALALTAITCSSDNDSSSLRSGKLDMQRFVVVGNSLTAGMVSGGWSYSMVQNAYPALIMKAAFGTAAVGDGSLKEAFVVPRISDPAVLLPIRVAAYSEVGEYANGAKVRRYTTIPGGTDITKMLPENLTYEKPFNNLAVPGATARDLLNETTGLTATLASPPFGNPLFQLVTRERAPSVAQAVELKPTLALFWAGNNEILSAALSGGVRAPFPFDDQTGIPGFRTHHANAINRLLETGAKVVTATIPNVTVIPAVSMVGFISSKNERAYIADLDGNQVFTDTLAFWGTDNGETRKLRGSERVLMGWMGREPETNGGRLYGLTESDPLPDNLWLSDAELNTISTVTAQYNSYINTWAENPNVAVVDIFGVFNDMAAKNGQQYTLNGQTFTVDLSLPYGGFFSLDGVHPDAMGQQVLANIFASVINQKFDAMLPSIPVVKPAAKVALQTKGWPQGAPASEPLFQWMRLLGLPAQ
jgi:hypothetical protein